MITLIRACAHVLVGDDKENEMNLILNVCVVVSAGAVTFKSSVVIFGSRQKFVRSWALLASLRSCSKGVALLNTSTSVFIRRIAPSCLKSTFTQDPAAGYTCHTCDQRRSGECGVAQDQDLHQNKGFCGREAVTTP